jgi:hypothetical protein
MLDIKKGQGATEFAVIFGFVLFAFVMFLVIIQSNQGEKNKDRARLLLQNTALDVQDEINLAAESSDGYIREFKVPEEILGKEYEINLTGGRVQASIEGYYVSYKIFSATGNIQKGSNLIRKENRTVYLN